MCNATRLTASGALPAVAALAAGSGLSPAPESVTPSGLWTSASQLLAAQNQFPALSGAAAASPEAPLAFAQERLWWLEQLEPGIPYYTVPLLWEIQGHLREAALRQSLEFLVQRHSILRTCYPRGSSGPMQLVAHGPLELKTEDLRSQPAAHALALAQARQLAQTAFDLQKAPPLLAALYRYGTTQYLLAFVVHQINFDGASIRIFSQELAAAYRAFAGSRLPQLPPLPVEYADFARWQRACVQSQALLPSLDYWRTRLARPSAPLALPADHPHTQTRFIPGRVLPVHLSAQTTRTLKQCAATLGITPFAALLGAWHAFLCRVTDSDEVLTFVSVAGRLRPELRPLIGLLANILPLKDDFSDNPAFCEALRRSGETVASALAHQMVPLSQILEAMPRPQGHSQASQLQVQVLYNNAPLPVLELPDVTFIPSHAVDNGTARFELSLDVADTPNGISGYLKYRADRFEPPTIERLLQNWELALSQMLATPEQPIRPGTHPKGRPQDSPPPQSAAPAAPQPLSEPPSSTSSPSPITSLETTLTQIWERTFKLHPIGLRDNFFSLGGHSLVALKLATAIEQATGRTTRLHLLFEHPTIERLARALEATSGTACPSLVEIQPEGSRPPLFLVHGVGGGMFWGYSNLARQLDREQPVYAFKSRGLDGREEFSRVEDMAAQYVADLRAFQPGGPYLLGGYCFGGNVAYEMARQLTAQNQPVALLVLINCWSSNSSYTRVTPTPSFFALALWNFCRRLEHQIEFGARQPRAFFQWRLLWTWRRLRALLSQRLEDRLAVQELVAGAPRPAEEQKLWRAHLQAWLQYKPGPYPGRVELFRTRGHPLFCSFDPQMGWGALASGGVGVHTCPGDHESILEEQNVPFLAAELKKILHSLPA